MKWISIERIMEGIFLLEHTHTDNYEHVQCKQVCNIHRLLCIYHNYAT